jgi:hypothetical protein
MPDMPRVDACPEPTTRSRIAGHRENEGGSMAESELYRKGAARR